MGKKNEEIEDLILSPRNARVAPLWAWLMKHDATCHWHQAVMGLHGDPKRRMATIECWGVRAGIVLIKIDKHGWSIFSEPQTNHIEATLADAEARCMPPDAAGAPATTPLATIAMRLAEVESKMRSPSAEAYPGIAERLTGEANGLRFAVTALTEGK